MTRTWQRALRPGRRVQRPHRGERRRHPRGAGLRQRGPRARALRRRQRSATARPSWRPTGSWPPSMSLSYLSMRLTQLVVMIAGTYFVLQGELTDGGFVGFLLLVGVFFRPIEKINAVLETYPKGIAGFRRYTELLDTEPDIADAPGRGRRSRTCAARSATRTSRFGYTPRPRRCCADIDLAIRAGETVAFVGPSGAGKTTICSLLPRFYEVDGGPHHHRRHRHPRHDAGLAAAADRHRAAGRLPVRRHASARTSPTAGSTRPKPRSWRRRGGRGSTT